MPPPPESQRSAPGAGAASAPPEDGRASAGRRLAVGDAIDGAGAGLASETLADLGELLALDGRARRAVRGVRLAPDDDLGALLAELDHLDLVAIEFPAFTDGRGFSHARRLRAVHGFAGELRAVGDVRPDQARQMLACGLDALEFAEAPAPGLLERSLGRFPDGYQRSYRRPAAELRTGPAPAADRHRAQDAPGA